MQGFGFQGEAVVVFADYHCEKTDGGVFAGELKLQFFVFVVRFGEDRHEV